jgi:hypothetical protein
MLHVTAQQQSQEFVINPNPRAAPDFLLTKMWPRPLGAGGLRNDRGLLSLLGIESAPILSLLAHLQICKFVKAYAHRPVILEAVAASSSASSEATDGPTGV